MSPLLLFGLLLLITFGVIVWMLKPSKTETDVQRHLSNIGTFHTLDADASTILRQEALSSIPWLNDLLHYIPRALQLRLLITQAGRNWSVASVLFGSVAAGFAAGAAASVFAPVVPLPLLAGGAVAFAPYSYLLWQRAARFRRFEEVLPEAIDLMSRALKAGHAVAAMIEMVGQETSEPVASEFRMVFEEQNLGLPLREAILNLARRVPSEDVLFLSTAILVQKETGGNLAEILDKTAFIMRERLRLKGAVRIYTAQGRVSGWVLCMMPFIMFAVLSIVNPSYESKLWKDPLGLDLVYGALGMMAIGVLIIRKIVDIDV